MKVERFTRLLAAGTTAAALVLALPGDSHAAPVNDRFEDATRVALLEPEIGSNVGATELDAEPLTPSGSGSCGGAQMTRTVWYLVPGTGGPITVHTRGSGIDSSMAVYDTDGTATPDNGPPTSAKLLDCGVSIPDDQNGDPDAVELTFESGANFDYLVQIGAGGSPAEGSVRFVAYDAPPNDARATPRQLEAGAPVTADNFGATVEQGERTSCGASSFGKTVWFRYSAPGTGTAVFSASGAGFDSVVTVYRSADGAVLGCNDDVSEIGGASRVGVRVGAGEYLIQVGGFGTLAAAEYDLFTVQAEFTGDAPPPPPDRDGDGIPDASDRCPDQNARARDANADGCLDPGTLRSTVTANWSAFARFTRLRSMAANYLPAGATVKVTCRSKPRKRCPYRSRSYRVRTAKRKLNLRKPFGRRKLPVGTVVTVQITAPGYVGKVWRYRIRSRKLPRTTPLCLPPGASRPGPCA